MMNPRNMMYFYGRLVDNPKAGMKQGNNGQYATSMFRLAVERVLTQQQKQANQQAKQNNQPVPYKEADFPTISANGNLADLVNRTCSKGKPIGVWVSYQQYESQNTQTGQKEYKHIFRLENLMFSMSDPTQNAQGGNYSNNNYNQTSQNSGYQNNNSPKFVGSPSNQATDRGGYPNNSYSVSDDDIPF